MATKEELYISVPPRTYRRNKSSALMSQANLLATLKRLHHLKILARRKNDLKVRLHKLLSTILNEIDSIQDSMPTPKVPKAIQKEELEIKKPKETFSKRNDIEDELMLINAKLQELNN